MTKPLQLEYGLRDESFQSRTRESGYQRCSDEIQDSKSQYKPILEGEVP